MTIFQEMQCSSNCVWHREFLCQVPHFVADVARGKRNRCSVEMESSSSSRPSQSAFHCWKYCHRFKNVQHKNVCVKNNLWKPKFKLLLSAKTSALKSEETLSPKETPSHFVEFIQYICGLCYYCLCEGNCVHCKSFEIFKDEKKIVYCSLDYFEVIQKYSLLFFVIHCV